MQRNNIMSELHDISERLNAVLEGERLQWHESGPPAAEVFRSVIPKGARIRAARRKEGTYDAYVVMPEGWRPRERSVVHWIYNEARDHCWFSAGPYPTEKEALREALIRLLSADKVKDNPPKIRA